MRVVSEGRDVSLLYFSESFGEIEVKMSWDERRYKATCSDCGHEGVQIWRSDEWGRTEERWEGFNTVPANDYELYRKRSEAIIPVCKCGSRNVVTDRTPLS
ncbi:hypothetical protein PMI21_05507 [Pseudomonas sp. GM18]|nr:hypothetical protein PMI21_05507 [Pseudomonas sp. GM18]